MTLKLYGSGSIENVDSIVTSASANISGTELGYIDGVTSAIQTQLNNAGKILQIVRATDTTNRTTTSTSLVDVTGMSVTITPQKSDSAILVIASFLGIAQVTSGTDSRAVYRLADSSDNAMSGAENARQYELDTTNQQIMVTLIGYATPATTSAVTYKLRHKAGIATSESTIINSTNTGQMYAIEVSA